MIDAHLDQLGFIVNNIDEHGQISLLPIGGGDSSIMSSKNLLILTRNGHVNAVVNRKASHQVENEIDELIEHTHDAVVDIGIRGRKKVGSVIEVGDPVVYRPSFEHLREQYYTGCGLDDKVGCFVLLEIIDKIVRSKRKPSATLVFTFSSQEETWGRKCRPLLKRFEPDAFVEVDVTFASDWDEQSWEYERQVGRCVPGEGPVLHRGVDIDEPCLNLLKRQVRSAKVPVQYQASTGAVGYTATEVSNEGHGVRALVLGLPLRNMHTPVEIVHFRDLLNGVKLLSGYLLRKDLGKLLS
jgi:endoglucanase